MSTNFRQLTANGLWHNNTAIVQLLGLCPLLAVSNSLVNGLGLGLATTFVLMASNLSVSLIRHQVSDAIRLPAFILIIASFTSCIELLMHAFTYELYQILGIFIPLIVTNCALLGRAEAFASKNPLLPSMVDGLMIGLGFTLALIVLGGLRELIGNGTVFANMHLLFGDGARDWTLTIPHYPKFLFFILPPGAFLVLGFMIAGKNLIDLKRKEREAAQAVPATVGAKRVRTTGHIG